MTNISAENQMEMAAEIYMIRKKEFGVLESFKGRLLSEYYPK